MIRRTLKETIIVAYSTGNYTLRQLNAIYKVNHTTISRWVRQYSQTEMGEKLKLKEALKSAKKKQDKSQEPEAMPAKVGELQAELAKARLENKLLNAMIDVAEENLKVKIRKKAGAKRS